MATWEAAFRLIGWRPNLFPAPSTILDSLLGMLNLDVAFGEPLRAHWPWIDGPARTGGAGWYASPLVVALCTSGVRLLIGFLASIILGGLIGALMWRFVAFDSFFGPVCLGLQTLPSVCWVPLAIIFCGLKEWGIPFVLIMGSCFAVAIAMRDGLRTIPPLYQQAGLMLGAHGWRFYRYILFPASLPALATSLRQGFSFAWRSLMGAELILTFVPWHGLGYLLDLGRSQSDVAQVLAVMILMVVIGMIADRWVFARVQRSVFARFGLVPAQR